MREPVREPVHQRGREPRRHDLANGDVWRLEAGDYLAEVASVGATLGRLSWQGHDLVVPLGDPASPTAYPPAYSGKVLAPWPNRIRDGRYTWDGEDHETAITEPATGTALHGLVCWQEWRVVGAPTSARLALGTDVYPRPGYPYRLGLTLVADLDAHVGLAVTITARNLGEVDAPYGVAFHPYLRCGEGPIDDCVLDLPAETVVTVDHRLLPTGTAPASSESLDFTTGAAIGARSIDHAVSGLPANGWEASLHRPGMPFRTVVRSDTGWVQLYTGDYLHRAGLAVEPMSCPPDAFNSGDGVVRLGPGERHALTVALAAEPT